MEMSSVSGNGTWAALLITVWSYMLNSNNNEPVGANLLMASDLLE